MNPYVTTTPEFHLPNELHEILLNDINGNTCIKAPLNYSKKTTLPTDSWLYKFYMSISFGNGTLQNYRLSELVEQQVVNYFQDFLNFVNQPYKIRYKSMQNVRWCLPHTDRFARGTDSAGSFRSTDGAGTIMGDSCSIYIGIITNNEITNWYSGPTNFQFGDNVFNLFKLKKQESICLEDKKSCLFNNAAIHSVSNCDSSKQRWGLAISWKDISYDELAGLYQRYITK
jgi:hypothetical protein